MRHLTLQQRSRCGGRHVTAAAARAAQRRQPHRCRAPHCSSSSSISISPSHTSSSSSSSRQQAKRCRAHQQPGHSTTSSSHSRRALLLVPPATAALLTCLPARAMDVAFLRAFQAALAADGSFDSRDAAWGRVIALAPDNAAAWSNRGTLRLQHQQWAGAADDLMRAATLEQQQAGAASAFVLNQLGNVEGALGRWDDAMAHYSAAAEDEELGAIAAANFALAAFETGRDEAAVRAARKLLRRDPQFVDMRCALTAFLWGSGQRAEAEGAWEELQQASDGLAAAMYSRSSAVERVRHRWPPRATAALVAFLALSDKGSAEGYDLVLREYSFPEAAAAPAAAV